MAEMTEGELREQAYARRGEVVVGSGIPIEGRRLGTMVSVRLEPEMIAALRQIADRRDQSISELLREGASKVIAADALAAPQVEITSVEVTFLPVGGPNTLFVTSSSYSVSDTSRVLDRHGQTSAR